MEFDIRQLIEEESIETLMQLVISPNEEYAAGVEALSRGIHPQTREHISPIAMIQKAKRAGLELELEKLMLKKAIEAYKPLHEESPDLLLFLNVGIEFIELCLSSAFIEEIIASHGIAPGSIFFDITAFDYGRMTTVKDFVSLYRPKGYFICVDDLGLDYNNLDRILYLSPDLVKINIKSLRELENKEYMLRMIQTLKFVAETYGIILVAKRIEDESDVSFAFECGVQFMQGYYISRPLGLTYTALKAISENYRNQMEVRLPELSGGFNLPRPLSTKAYHLIMDVKNSLISELAENGACDCSKLLNQYPMVESLWQLDEDGRQQGITWINQEHHAIRKASLFHIHGSGSDFSTSDLFRRLYDTILEVWITPPFQSVLTNNLCVNCSVKTGISAEQAVLCLRVNIASLEKTLRTAAGEWHQDAETGWHIISET